MVIFDTKTKAKQTLETIEKGKVRIYSCGPTVYDDAHLGHARNAVVFDLLHRLLKISGYTVMMVKNYTDIDDKIINRAKKENRQVADISDFYITRYQAEMALLNILPEHANPKATEYIEAMINDIQTLMTKGYAYSLDDGIYFTTTADKLYGTISHRDKADHDEEYQRVEGNKAKRHRADFALWKFEHDQHISYDAPFGRGRPGWHSECASMINRLFAQEGGVEEGVKEQALVDIHCGGADLCFPHHENEATQIRMLKDTEIAKYWMHNGFVQIDDEKMSKSLGNSFFLKEVLKDHHPEVVRFYLLSTHYRLNFNFSQEGLQEAKKSVDKIYRLKKQVFDTRTPEILHNDITASIITALQDDMNISKALKHINAFISEANECLSQQTMGKKELQQYQVMVAQFVYLLEQLLGVGGSDPWAYFQFGLSTEKINQINNLIAKRNAYREQKNYGQADEIKRDLMGMGVTIMDTPKGTVWEKE